MDPRPYATRSSRPRRRSKRAPSRRWCSTRATRSRSRAPSSQRTTSTRQRAPCIGTRTPSMPGPGPTTPSTGTPSSALRSTPCSRRRSASSMTSWCRSSQRRLGSVTSWTRCARPHTCPAGSRRRAGWTAERSRQRPSCSPVATACCTCRPVGSIRRPHCSSARTRSASISTRTRRSRTSGPTFSTRCGATIPKRSTFCRRCSAIFSRPRRRTRRPS